MQSLFSLLLTDLQNHWFSAVAVERGVHFPDPVASSLFTRTSGERPINASCKYEASSLQHLCDMTAPMHVYNLQYVPKLLFCSFWYHNKISICDSFGILSGVYTVTI